MAWLLSLALLSLASRALAQGAARVAIDWQGVSDRDIERCGLSRLRAGVIERLVSEGYALVETVDAGGVQVAIASSERGISPLFRARVFPQEASPGWTCCGRSSRRLRPWSR